MARKLTKNTSPKEVVKVKRRLRIRKKIEGTAERPRLCVTKTNRALSIQVIDDNEAKTLFSLRTPAGKSANKESATQLGKDVAAKAIEKGINNVVFDRSGNLYHGRVAALAAGAREAGLKF
ncbi:50S ribosomal protein L18 [bacterium]|nr:50S ribosomal protein L18 [bacterium]